MRRSQCLVLLSIFIFNHVNCQHGNNYFKRNGIGPLASGNPFIRYTRAIDYFIPRRPLLPINRRRNHLTAISRRRKIWGRGCNCEYFDRGDSEGCMIVNGAMEEGYICECQYLTLSTCDGTKVDCAKNWIEYCPVGCTSLLCCQQTWGNCGGYPSSPSVPR